MTKKQRRIFTPEFKEQMVKLYENGKSKKDIIAEYELTTTAFNTWRKSNSHKYSISGMCRVLEVNRSTYYYESEVKEITYVRVNKKWSYVCFLVDLFNREIVGYSCGPNKDAPLVYKAFSNYLIPFIYI